MDVQKERIEGSTDDFEFTLFSCFSCLPCSNPTLCIQWLLCVRGFNLFYISADEGGGKSSWPLPLSSSTSVTACNEDGKVEEEEEEEDVAEEGTRCVKEDKMAKIFIISSGVFSGSLQGPKRRRAT